MNSRRTKSFFCACFTIPEAANVPAEEHDDVINGLKSVAEVLLGEQGDLFDRELFVQSVRTAFSVSTANAHSHPPR